MTKIYGKLDNPGGARANRPLRTMKSFTASLFAVALLALSVACSTESSKPAEPVKEQPKGPELQTGRTAFQKAFIAARGWNRDAQPYRIESMTTSDGNGRDGKAALWKGSFASATQRATKAWVWSGSAAPDAPARGINPEREDSYSSTNSSTQVFDGAFLKIDSDQAFTVAQKHGGEKLLEKAPDNAVTYMCDWNHNTNELAWHVSYGNKLKVEINASSGEFIRVEK
jgi:hypothetical protein